MILRPRKSSLILGLSRIFFIFKVPFKKTNYYLGGINDIDLSYLIVFLFIQENSKISPNALIH